MKRLFVNDLVVFFLLILVVIGTCAFRAKVRKYKRQRVIRTSNGGAEIV